VGETAEKGAALTGQLRQDVRASVEPTKAQQFAIATTLTFELTPESAGEKSAVTAVCALIGFYSVARTLTAQDEPALTEEITNRINLQIFPIARGKLVRLFAEAGMNTDGVPMEQNVELATPIRVPKSTATTQRKRTKKLQRQKDTD